MGFWTKFAQKGYFPKKTEQVNSSTEFCIFELAYYPGKNIGNEIEKCRKIG